MKLAGLSFVCLLVIFGSVRVNAIYDEFIKDVLESLGFEVTDDSEENVTSADNSTINSE